MVVIIAAGPFTLRNGRNDTRSMSTPSAPEQTMVTANAAISAPASGSPTRMMFWPDSPKSCSVHMPMKLPIMKTLKCEKLISSRMP